MAITANVIVFEIQNLFSLSAAETHVFSHQRSVGSGARCTVIFWPLQRKQNATVRRMAPIRGLRWT